MCFDGKQMALNLTPETIKGLTYPDYFQRGWDYFREGRVRNYRDKGDELTATVIGSEDYAVRADLAALEFACDCLAFRHETPCKHVVALLLTKIYGEHSVEKKAHNAAGRGKLKPERADETALAKDRRPSRLAPEELFDLVEKKIKAKIRSLDYHSDYWNYVENQDEFSSFVTRQISTLPVSRASTFFLLELAVWLDEQLTNYDDSDGILQDTLWQVLGRAVRHLNQTGPAGLKTFYGFTRRDSSFDLPSKIVEAILAEVDNPTVKTELVNKLEAYLDKDDPDFSFGSQTARWLLADHLGTIDPARFEKIALRFYREDAHVRTALVEFYYQRRNYEKVLDIGWEERHNPYFEKSVLTALNNLNQTEKLILFYQEKIAEQLTKEDLRTLRELHQQTAKEREWEDYLRRLEEKRMSLFEKIDLCLFLKDYQRLTDALLLSKEDLHERSPLIEDYARKLAVLEPNQAIRLYRFLFQKEAGKLKTSHHYARLFAQAEKLRSLGEDRFLKEKLVELKERYPKHAKLREGIDEFLGKS